MSIFLEDFFRFVISSFSHSGEQNLSPSGIGASQFQQWEWGGNPTVIRFTQLVGSI